MYGRGDDCGAGIDGIGGKGFVERGEPDGGGGILIDPPEGILPVFPNDPPELAVTGDPLTGDLVAPELPAPPTLLLLVCIEALGDPPSPSESSGLAIYRPGATPRRRAPCGRRDGAGMGVEGVNDEEDWVWTDNRGGGLAMASEVRGDHVLSVSSRSIYISTGMQLEAEHSSRMGASTVEVKKKCLQSEEAEGCGSLGEGWRWGPNVGRLRDEPRIEQTKDIPLPQTVVVRGKEWDVRYMLFI